MATQNGGAIATKAARSNKTASKKPSSLTQRFPLTLQISQAELDVLLIQLESLLTVDSGSTDIMRGQEVLDRAHAAGRPFEVVCASNVYQQLLRFWGGEATSASTTWDEAEQVQLLARHGAELLNAEVCHA